MWGETLMEINYHKVNRDYVQYTCRLDVELLEKIKDIAKKENISINECIHQSLELIVNNYNKQDNKK